jgi:hypothetical protein
MASEAPDGGDRGKRATFDRKTGEVSGSGSGAGDPGAGNEDYDQDLGTGTGADREQGLPGNGA